MSGEHHPDDIYDYVIVGAGSAGAVLAARLTEDPRTTVLLLEAGGEANADEISIPAAFAALFKTKWDWNYETSDQKQLNSRKAYWPRMKALGGCSSMNAMIYIRGNKADYDGWRDQHGATGWGYADVLPYFVKSEGNTRFGGPFHGQAGPLHVEDRVWTHEMSTAFVDSAVSAGLKPNDDFNGADQVGAGQYQVTCKNGRRWSTDNAFLAPVRSRDNLTVVTGALASRVVLDTSGSEPRATGVVCRRGGTEETVRARREVILCGGAVNSPQLLMLSGIGPGNHLAEVGIETVVDLAGVGANLHDHPAVPLVWRTRGTTDLSQANNLGNFARWKLRRPGPLSSNLGEAGAFFPTRDGLAAPDMQVHVAPTGFFDNGMQEPTQTMFTAAPTLVSVASRGSVRLRSTDPTWHPTIDAGYYEDQTDLDAMVAGLRRTWDICTQGAVSRFLVEPWGLSSAPSDEELTEHARKHTQTLYHPVGTCAMGSGEDAVVDATLAVRGVAGLRVVDASVMPVVPRGNTNAPTIMIAEKTADLIRSTR